MRAVCKDGTRLPLVDPLLNEPKALSQDAGGFITGCDLGTHGGRGAGVLAGLSTWLHSLDGLQGLYQLLQIPSGHEDWIAFGVYAIVRDATLNF